MNYLDESGVKQLLEYLELQHAAINKRLDQMDATLGKLSTLLQEAMNNDV